MTLQQPEKSTLWVFEDLIYTRIYWILCFTVVSSYCTQKKPKQLLRRKKRAIPNSLIGIPMRCYHGNTLPGFVATTIMIIIIIFINNHHQQSSSSSSTIIINNHHHHHHQQSSSSSSSSSSTIIINNRHLLYIAISLLVFPTTCNLTQIPNLVNFMTSNFEGFPSTTSTTNGALGLEVWKSPSLFWYKAYDALAIFPASRAISTDMSLRRCSKRLL